jgi:hypothetical protein
MGSGNVRAVHLPFTGGGLWVDGLVRPTGESLRVKQ